MNKGLEEVNLLKSWLSNIYARAPGCPVIVVGTHYDKIHKSKRIEVVHQFIERLNELKTKPGKKSNLCFTVELIKVLYSRKDSNLVFSRFISHGEVLCYNRAKIHSFILKFLENSLEYQPITPKFVLCIVSILHYTKQSLDFPI